MHMNGGGRVKERLERSERVGEEKLKGGGESKRDYDNETWRGE